MPKHSIMFCRFPGGWSNVQQEHPDSVDWYTETIIKAKADPRIGDVFFWRKGDTPVPMIRNRMIHNAEGYKADLLCILDSDMNPDAYLHTSTRRIGIDPFAKPFWESSLDFLLSSKDPCVVAAPYCGPSPNQNVYVFQWATRTSQEINCDFRLEMFTREEAARRAGIEEVAALPTGLCLIDMRVFKNMPRPHFYYEWKGDGEKCDHCGQRKPGEQIEKASTEDVTWSRDISMLWRASRGQQGGRIYCNWDAWAGHWKLECVGKPMLLNVNSISDRYIEAISANRRIDERIVEVGAGQLTNDPNHPLINGHVTREKVAT